MLGTPPKTEPPMRGRLYRPRSKVRAQAPSGICHRRREYRVVGSCWKIASGIRGNRALPPTQEISHILNKSLKESGPVTTIHVFGVLKI